MQLLHYVAAMGKHPSPTKDSRTTDRTLDAVHLVLLFLTEVGSLQVDKLLSCLGTMRIVWQNAHISLTNMYEGQQ